MEFLRNTIAVILGLGVAMLTITFGLKLNSAWITYTEFSPFKNWGRLLEAVREDEGFFFALLVSSGVGSTIGGVVTALIVKYAKVAYAILIGFILLFITMLDIIVFPYHPTFFKICIFLTFFPFAWIGGKITEIIYDRKKKRKLANKLNNK